MATESSSKSVQYSEYSENMSISDKRRYLEKTEDIGDPYAYLLGVLNQDDLPPVRSTIDSILSMGQLIFLIIWY